ncbi:MAG: PHP domain-containing protein [Roseburia sp.]|nr:PHP domain-containing protein [Roseburia sp.]
MLNLFHVHTYRCNHAENISDELYIKRALQLHANSITFTDHAPFPGNCFGNRMQYEQLPEYISTLQELKMRYQGQIDVKIGLEIEYLPSFQSYYEELAACQHLDILMVGQHFYEEKPGQYSFLLKNKNEVEHRGCMTAIHQAIETGFFSVIAHPDRSFRRVTGWNEECTTLSRAVIESAAAKGIVLERNLSSLEQKNYFRTEFWNLLLPNNKTVTGLDAHALSELERDENKLKNIGRKMYASRVRC